MRRLISQMNKHQEHSSIPFSYNQPGVSSDNIRDISSKN